LLTGFPSVFVRSPDRKVWRPLLSTNDPQELGKLYKCSARTIEQQRFRDFGCSDCGWQFTQSGPLPGTSFDEMMRNFELQRDKEFTLHVCAEHPRAKSSE